MHRCLTPNLLQKLGLKCGFCVWLALLTASLYGQDELINIGTDSTERDAYVAGVDTRVAAGIQYDTSFVSAKLRRKDQPLTVFGYYRFFAYGRNMTQAYPNLSPFERAYSIGDGYREPMLSMTVIGRPNGKASFATELYAFTPYLGGDETDNVFSTNLGLNFYGNFRTQHGNFGVRAGGIHWYNLSDFTIGVFQILDRFSIFDRTPWEGVSNTEKYQAYFETGATNPGDLRWNTQAFHGLILNGGKLPGNFNFDLFWGKTQPNGGLPNGILDGFESIPTTLDYGEVPTYLGFNGDARNLPNYITGGKIGRTFGRKRSSVSYNLIHSTTALDSMRSFANLDSTFSIPQRTFQIHSLNYNLKFSQLRITGELAAGYYESPTYERTWGEALMLRAYTTKELTIIPLDIQVYQISKNFFNPNSAIATNSNPDILKDFGLAAGATGVGGQLALVNQLVHNRRGIDINTGFELGEVFRFNLGWSLSQEIEALATELTYVHRVNGLALSRIYNPFPANATRPTIFGPYQRKISFFRGVSEIVQTTDLDPATAEAFNRKFFNAVDLQAKLKTMIGDRALYFFYLGSFNSAKTNAAPVPSLDDDTYLFVQYHELDAYLQVFPRFLLTTYLGWEAGQGGRFTAWDAENQLPLDQVGRAVGIGCDWQVSESTGIYIRHRWMDFEDRSFQLDRFQGQETTIELKTFF